MDAIRIEKSVGAPMRDGVTLRADIYRLDDTERRPAILFRTPYNKDAVQLDMLRPIDCAAAGFVAVVQDCRGRFASDGDWAFSTAAARPGGMTAGWQLEAQDTADTIAWIAAQRWCDGQVGMAGASYLGMLQWWAAELAPPALKAFSPALSTSPLLDREETGGCFRLDHVAGWFAMMSLDWLQKSLKEGRQIDPADIARLGAAARNLDDVTSYLPLRDVPHFSLPGYEAKFSNLFDDAELSDARDWEYERIEIPSLSIGGWFDTFCTATVRQFQALTKGGTAEAGSHHLIMGPWVHSGVFPQTQGELNFGVMSAASAFRLGEKSLAFFRKALKGEATDLAPVTYFLMRADEWREAVSWPPPGTKSLAFHLSSEGNAASNGGRLTTTEPDGTGAEFDEYDYDPLTPTPSHGGRVLYLGKLVGGPLDQAVVERRPDVLSYSSDVLQASMDVVGSCCAEISVSSSANDTDFIAKLVDVFPDGRAILVADGALRTRYRKGFDTPLPLEAGEIVQLVIQLGETAWRFEPGHRVRLLVMSSNFPHLDRSMNRFAPIGSVADPQTAQQRLYHSQTHRSLLRLSVLQE